jgi:hypothetical protein
LPGFFLYEFGDAMLNSLEFSFVSQEFKTFCKRIKEEGTGPGRKIGTLLSFIRNIKLIRRVV